MDSRLRRSLDTKALIAFEHAHAHYDIEAQSSWRRVQAWIQEQILPSTEYWKQILVNTTAVLFGCLLGCCFALAAMGSST